MKAAWYGHFGPAAEVLVRLHASAVNPSDAKKRAGSFPNLLDDGYVIPHSDGAGIIEAVGEGVSSDRIGDGVWVYQAQYGRPLDRVIEVEFGANLAEVLKLVRTGATIATYSSTQVPQPKLPFYQMMYRDLRIRLVIVYAMPEEAKQQAIADIDEASHAGTLQHRVAHVLRLDEIAKAHALIEDGGFRGCVVLRP